MRARRDDPRMVAPQRPALGPRLAHVSLHRRAGRRGRARKRRRQELGGVARSRTRQSRREYQAMSHLLREFAPITDGAWHEVEEEARRTLTHFLTSRRLVDFAGPHGWDYDAVPSRRTIDLP